ncbi:uracil phosphoribosyltransferase [Clostridia bacterium]|nr:uracil phosphoribosyltransferase [Clostridia bacterium]
MKNLRVMDHPLIQHKITYLRDINTKTKEFRELAGEIAMLMAYEATQNLQTEEHSVTTPLTTCQGFKLAGKGVVIVPILRAGLGMVDGMLNLIPNASVGHIGLCRDEKTLKPMEYYVKLPKDIAEREVILVDPMLATGGSASQAITFLKSCGVEKIRFMCLIGAPEGVKKLNDEHPDVKIFMGTLDDCLNQHGYIVPGLGDAGDRLFGTD